MTSSQRLIKSVAICLALFIVLSIIGFFVWLVLSFTNFYDNKDVKLHEYTLYDVADIDMNIGSANVIIKKGDTFKLEISDYSNYKVNGNKLYIENKNKIYRKNDKVILSIPEDKKFDTFTLDGGAGNVEVERVIADRVTLKLGAGKTTLDNVISKTLKIDAGVGDFKLFDGKTDSFDIDLGVGNVDIKIEASDGYADVGIGNLNLTLKDGLSNYTFDLEKGIGNINYNGMNVSTGTYGSGTSKIKVNGGIGNIKIGD